MDAQQTVVFEPVCARVVFDCGTDPQYYPYEPGVGHEHVRFRFNVTIA